MATQRKPREHEIGDVVNDWTVIDYGLNRLSFVWRHKCGHTITAGAKKISDTYSCTRCYPSRSGWRLKGETNICFDCDRAVLDCSWSESFKPVDGWTAEPVDRVVQRKVDGKNVYAKEKCGYHVIACPLFIQKKAVR